jgi:nitrite reductase (NO-forming)
MKAVQLYRFNCDGESAREKPALAVLGQARLAKRHAREASGFNGQAPVRAVSIAPAPAQWLALAMVVLIGVLSVPKNGRAEEKSFSLTAENRRVDIGSGMTYDAMTYDGTVPGPVLRVRQGDDVTIELTNQTTDAHGINIYAAQIDPKLFGETSTKKTRYQFRATVPGVFDYHCSAFPVLDHVAGGMYGMMIVEPKEGWPNGEAQEVTLVQNEFYGLADQYGLIRPDHSQMVAADANFLGFNGGVARYDLHNPIPIKVGKLVRIFFVNAGPSLVSTFAINGVIFSTVYRGGNPQDVMRNIKTLEVGPGNGAVFEFTVNEPGDYQFADGSLSHSYKGARGIFRATR